jgi:hypothetical protein
MAPSPVVALTLMREIVAVHPQFADRDLLNLYRLFVRTGLYGAPTCLGLVSELLAACR